MSRPVSIELAADAPIKAHQRIIRERLAADPEVTLFGVEGENVDTDLKKATVREIDASTAAVIILKYEWLGTMPMCVRRCFGLYHDTVLSGAVVFAEKPFANVPYFRALRARSCSSNGTNVIADALYLARGACAYWAHPHAASWFIARACQQQAPCTVLAYADPDAGEVGTIYQALGWSYIGPEGTNNAFLVDGVRVSTRSLSRRADIDEAAPLFENTPDAQLFRAPCFGKTAADARRKFPAAVDIVPVKSKGRYIGVYGDRRFKKTMNRRLLPAALPYPKREEIR